MPIPTLDDVRLDLARLQEKFGEAVLGSKVALGDQFVFVKRESIVDVVKFLKEDDELQYVYFVEALGVDYSDWQNPRDLSARFEVVYNLYSLKHSSRLFLKVGVDDGQAIPTLKGVFLGAEYPEREIMDMFGIRFEGHNPIGRFLMSDDWIGYPLRKEYPLGGEDVLFDWGDHGPAVEDVQVPHAGDSFEGRTGTST